MIEINNQNEIEKYYNDEIDTYIFSESVEFNCDIYVKSHIKALDIVASRIYANNISYYAICIAYEKFKCKKIEGRHRNAMHKCLNHNIEFINDEE